MSDDTREVGIYISGYIVKKIKDRFEDCCIEYAVGEIKEDDADGAYLKINIKRRIESSFIESFKLFMRSIRTARLLQ